MQLEQAILLLEPKLDVYLEQEEELMAFEQMIRASFDCFVINQENTLIYDVNDIKSLKLPTNVKVYNLDCNFYKSHIGKAEDIKVINPHISKMWISSTDTRADFSEALESIKADKLSGFLEIKSKFLGVDSFLYFKNGEILNVKFGDLEQEPAIGFLVKKISDRIVSMNFYKLKEDMVKVYASSHKLLYLEEDEVIKSLDFGLDLKNVLVQGMFPSGYFQIYIENGKKIFQILNDELVDKIEIYEPFYLAVFSLEFKKTELDIFDFLKSYKPANIRLKPTSADKNFVFFCPMCWNAINQEDKICPHCGYNIEYFIKLPYETKLIIALNHPIADYRITALNVIKVKNVKMAVPFVKEIILKEDNPAVIQAAINTLVVMDEKACEFLKGVLEEHEYNTIKRYVEETYRRYCR
ncbi:HEAT repeat domain-containing protein [Hydrogenobaculum acidophilum]